MITFQAMSPPMNYQRRIQAAHDAGHFKPGEVHNIHVEHQQGCAFRSGKCTCWPYIAAVNADSGEVVVIGSDGHILERVRKS